MSERTVREPLEREAEVPAAVYRAEERIRIVPDEQPRLRLLRRSPLSTCAAASKDRNARFINFGPLAIYIESDRRRASTRRFFPRDR